MGHPVFKFSRLEVSIEPMTNADLKQANKARWNIPPAHYLIVQGEDRGQFSTWELGESGGRIYFANRLKK